MATANSFVCRHPLILPSAVFSACILIRFLPVYYVHTGSLSTAITLDLALTAPLLYFLTTRGTTVSSRAVLRVFIAGVFVAGLLLTTSNPILGFIKTWISPVVELMVVLYVARQFYTGVRKARATGNEDLDFVMHCRTILGQVFGSTRAAAVIASEVAVFYYLFAPKQKANVLTRFSTYKESGSLMVLYTFLCLFLLETAGMHFVFSMWNGTAAWVLTGLSAYTCLQLLAHIRAVKARLVVLQGTAVWLRNGLLGGEVRLPYDNIDRVELTRKTLEGEGIVKLALIQGLENHNVALYLHHPVVITKAFGITRTATTILLSIDDAPAFGAAVERAKELA